MKKKYFLLSSFFYLTFLSFGQTTIQDLINQVSQSGIIQRVRDLSGEDSTYVGGNKVLIQHRVSNVGNNLAADYILEKLTSYGLNASAINYSTKGRNIVATQIGQVNPNNIYIISAHYDAVANYGADDNASGVTAVMEAARILSNYNFENTIVYSLWDEEEVGLKGATNYANTASSNNDNILANVNMDMIGYDGDNDKLFDIDVRNIANSNQITTDLINIVSTHNLNLVSNVVNPGTLDSDHSPFWSKGYSAVLLGEAWSNNDITPGYHSSNDRISLFNINYFFNMVKLCVGYISTKGVLINSTDISSSTFTQYKAFPNPTNGLFTIDFDNFINAEATVFSIYGEVVLNQQINGRYAKFNLENLTNGIYIIKIIDHKGTSSQIRVIKNK